MANKNKDWVPRHTSIKVDAFNIGGSALFRAMLVGWDVPGVKYIMKCGFSHDSIQDAERKLGEL